jgi:predicted RNA-binding protein with PUA-like domain
MKRGDLVLFYHSVVGKEVKGICEVTKEFYPDPTSDDPRWCVVDLRPVQTMRSPVTLDDIKSHPELEDIALIRQSRLSVMPLSKKELKIILKLGNTSARGI